MSRHRNVKQLVDDDYYDGYDDDYDDYDDYDDGYTGGSSNMQAKKKPVATAAAKKPSTAATQKAGATAASKSKTPTKAASASASVAAKNSSAKAPPKKATPTTTTATAVPTVPKKSSSVSSTIDATKSGPSSSSTSASSAQPIAADASLSLPPVPLILQESSSSLQSSMHQIQPLTVVVLGHVDAGKSTVTGHLLYGATTSTSSSNRKGGNKRQPVNYAWILDEDEQERAHGVTIDIATKVLELDPAIYLQSDAKGGGTTIWTPQHAYDIVLQDAPGHADYVPAMITGAATADVALLVVDATDLTQTALSAGQLREHVHIARGLGVSQILVVVNKMDVVGWDQVHAYRRIEHELVDFCTSNVGYPPSRVRCLPVSGVAGTNIFPMIANSSNNATGTTTLDANTALLRSWYTGPTLLEALYSFEPLPMPSQQQMLIADKPLRIIVSDVLDSSGSVNLRCKVVSGWVKVGETLVVLPVGDEAVLSKFTSLHGNASRLVHASAGASSSSSSSSSSSTKSATATMERERKLYAVAGEWIDGSITGIDAQRIAVGSLLVRSSHRPLLATSCRAKISILDSLTVPLIRGAQLMFHMHHIDVPCHCSALIRTVAHADLSVHETAAAAGSNSSATIRERPRALGKNSTAIVELQLAVPICMESYAECRALGRFVLRRSGDTVAIGRIEQVLQ